AAISAGATGSGSISPALQDCEPGTSDPRRAAVPSGIAATSSLDHNAIGLPGTVAQPPRCSPRSGLRGWALPRQAAAGRTACLAARGPAILTEPHRLPP